MSAVDAFDAASAARANGDFAGAARNYAAAIRANPNMAEAYMNAGWVLGELGRRDEAAHSYRFGLKNRVWPADTTAAAHNNVGVIMRDLGRSDEAAAEWRAALAAKPDFGPSLENLARESSTVSDGGDAAGGARREGGDDDLGALSYSGLINAGNQHLDRGALSEAASLYRRAIPMRDPRHDGSAYVGLGAALHGSQRLREAVHVLAAGAKLNPGSPGMLMNLAIVRADLEQWKGSASAWRRALALDPTNAGAYRAAFGAVKNAKGAAAALPYLAHAAALDPTNWHNHYTSAHAYLHEAYLHAPNATSTAPTSSPTLPLRDPDMEAAALRALRPLHRQPISMRMRSQTGAEPPWTRAGGRGLLGDQPPPKSFEEIWHAQADKRAAAAAAGRQSGVIVYKLGPKATEVEHLRLSLRLLMRHHNRIFRYPILIAHDDDAKLDAAQREELVEVARGAELRFVRLSVALPSWISDRSVPEQVLGFPVAYRHMIRWKVGLLWEMEEVQRYEYVWSLDTDAFLLGPISYDVFGWMKARNASYGYVDVNVETPQVADGLSDCVDAFLRRRPKLSPTMLHRFRSRRDRRWDGSKFYTNFQVARREFGRSKGYRDLFDHIDRDGGIYRHRWGADPILFLAVNIFLEEDAVVHFDDVPYLHQHLVANLPAEPTGPLEIELPPTHLPAAADDGEAGCESGAATEPSHGGGGDSARVMLYATDASHLAAAVDALTLWRSSTACEKPLEVLACMEAVGGEDEEDSSLAQMVTASLPPRTSLVGERIAACAIDDEAHTAWSGAIQGLQASAAAQVDAAGVAAAVSLLRASAIFSAARTGGDHHPRWRLLLVCVDATDGSTMATTLAARMHGVDVLNLCDEPYSQDDGLPAARRTDAATASGVAGHHQQRRLSAVMDRAVGCE